MLIVNKVLEVILNAFRRRARGSTCGICYLIAGAIISLKIVVIIQLVQFAITVTEAIAAAVPTAGASMSLIPIAKIAAQKAIEFALNMAVEKLLG